ncbi:MAG: amidohydrolase family protein, partial [Armatimonadetes bacterium]|nr:amidohydrolase family protein [Armatimonadota bacterium]
MLTITGEIVAPEGVLPGGALVVDGAGRIAEVGPRRASPPRSGDIDAEGLLVLPGFIDMHIHGGGGADFMHGTPEAARQVLRTHARFGTTGLLATTLTASRADTDRAVQAVRRVREEGRAADEARVLGLHLEGPYICPQRRGAQPAAFVRPPDVVEFAHWVALSGEAVRQITLAPETEGAQALAR